MYEFYVEVRMYSYMLVILTFVSCIDLGFLEFGTSNFRYIFYLNPSSFVLLMGVSSDNVIGLGLAIFSSIFIGSSYIIKKKGLMKAGASGIRAGLISLFAIYNLFLYVCMLLRYNLRQGVCMHVNYIYDMCKTSGCFIPN